MTHRRDVSLSVFAVALGLIMGTGTLTYIQQIPLDAKVSHEAAPPKHFTTRQNNRNGIPLRDEKSTDHAFPSVKTDETKGSVTVPAVLRETPCTAVRKAVQKIQVAYSKVIPNNVSTTAIRAEMDAAFLQAVSEQCGTDGPATEAAASTSSEGSVVTVDNHCEKYPKHTARYTQCVIWGELGKTYP